MNTLLQEKPSNLSVQDDYQAQLADRLRTEKAVLHHKVENEGFELGVRSSSKLSLADFRHFEKVAPIAAKLDEEALDYLWSFLAQKGYSNHTLINDADFNHLLEIDPESRLVFVQSWLDGVLMVWNAIASNT
ncbi:hypothetical protein [Synechocystis sp. LKSZ1]|uniref:hypothetical protein n=1 Tax=Synechocystis sp. LKSZ1 TaxID=3144951 RepID=UPI00336BF5AE